MEFVTKHIEEDSLRGVLIENPSYEQAHDLWQQAVTENDNVFLSWIWIGPWLRLIQDKAKVNLFLVYKQEEIIAAVFLIVNKQTRHGFITSRQIFLNEICANNLNMVIEYNNILIKSGYETSVYKLFSKFLLANNNWDELVLNATQIDNFKLINTELGFEHEIMDQGMSRQAILNQEGVDSSQTLKQSLLSSNKRSQINRSIKYIEKLHGDISLTKADSIDEAITYFDQLGVLHTEYWQKKGLPGSFANTNWVDFNKEIIRDGTDNGHVQLLHIHAGEFTIGYLYNLVYKGRIYNIQSGFNYLEDNKFKPGFISHWLAIEYYWEKEKAIYDFLAGGEEYKKSFSNSEIELVWAKIKRPSLSFFIENILKHLLRFIRSIKK